LPKKREKDEEYFFSAFLSASTAFFATFQRFAAASLTFTFSFDVYFFLLFFLVRAFLFSLAFFFLFIFSVFYFWPPTSWVHRFRFRSVCKWTLLIAAYIFYVWGLFSCFFLFGKAKRHLRLAVELRRWQVASGVARGGRWRWAAMKKRRATFLRLLSTKWC